MSLFDSLMLFVHERYEDGTIIVLAVLILIAAYLLWRKR